MKTRTWFLIAIIGAGVIYWTRRKPYAGMTASGWGGNWTGNLPTLYNPRVIVGKFSNGSPIYGPASTAGTAQGASQSYGVLP